MCAGSSGAVEAGRTQARPRKSARASVLSSNDLSRWAGPHIAVQGFMTRICKTCPAALQNCCHMHTISVCMPGCRHTALRGQVLVVQQMRNAAACRLQPPWLMTCSHCCVVQDCIHHWVTVVIVCGASARVSILDLRFLRATHQLHDLNCGS